MIPKLKQRAERGMGNSVITGAAIGIVVTILMLMIIAAIVNMGKMKEESTGYGIMTVLITASYLGGYVGCKKMGSRYLITGLLTGATYLGILLCINFLVFGGKLYGAGETVLLILCGHTVAVMWTSRGKRGMKKRKLKIPNR